MKHSNEADTYSISRLANLFGVARDTVSKRIAQLGIQPVGKKSGYPVYDLKDVAQIRTEESTNPALLDPSEMQPKDRKDWYASENERLKFEKDEGILLDREVVRQQFAQLVNSLAQKIQSYPDELERDKGVSPQEVERMIELGDSLQNGLAEVLNNNAM